MVVAVLEEGGGFETHGTLECKMVSKLYVSKAVLYPDVRFQNTLSASLGQPCICRYVSVASCVQVR